MTLTRVDVQSAIGRLCWALRQRNSALATRTVETGGYGGNGHPVGFDVHIWDQDCGPVTVGWTDTGLGISREPDHVLRADAEGWDVASLAGTWGIECDRHGVPVVDVELVAKFLAEEIDWRK